MNFSFVICTKNHLESLVDISRKTFIDAFEKDNDPTDFHIYVNKAFSKETLEKELCQPHMQFYFLYYGNTLAGYFKINELGAQTEAIDALSIELERIYVLKSFQGKKLGEAMLNKVIEISKQKQVDFLWLGVWEKNIGAIRFYERYGFKAFGSHDFFIGEDKQVDLLYRLDII